MATKINLSFEEMWERIMACDSKYDGLFFTAVKTSYLNKKAYIPGCKPFSLLFLFR
ncbi:hypothetical protein [Clostridium sp.]|uniref:hypothetical protein n=1 Tax=Clostridium sp. TaxID=1506 RepID=UPI002FC5B20C